MIDGKPIIEAIALKRCIEVTYNRMKMQLAPHALYTRHGDLFLDAVIVAREGRAFSEQKLGTFKLAGLGFEGLLAQPFHTMPGFDANDGKYQETTPFVVS